MTFYLEPMLNRDKKREENNRLTYWRKKNQKEAKEVAIIAQQSITHNRWKGLGIIFNSPTTYQVLEPIEKEAIIIVAQIDVEEVNKLTNDGTQ